MSWSFLNSVHPVCQFGLNLVLPDLFTHGLDGLGLGLVFCCS